MWVCPENSIAYFPYTRRVWNQGYEFWLFSYSPSTHRSLNLGSLLAKPQSSWSIEWIRAGAYQVVQNTNEVSHAIYNYYKALDVIDRKILEYDSKEERDRDWDLIMHNPVSLVVRDLI